jgi:hypothetical protein
MKTNLSLYAFGMLVLGTLLFSACKKDHDPINPADDKLIFVDKQWQLTAFILDPPVDLDGDNKPDSDLMPYLPDCSKDDILVFKADGKMGGNPGERCEDESSTGGINGTWSYNKDTKTLTITGNESATDVDEWKVVEMSATTLKAKVEVTEEGTTLTAYLLFKAK